MKKTDYSKVFVTSNHYFGSHLLVPQLQIYTKKQEDELIDKWNSVVGKNDIVFYNGGFIYYNNILYAKKYIDRLNGKITYITDNFHSCKYYKRIFMYVAYEIYLYDLDISISHDYISDDAYINIVSNIKSNSHLYENGYNIFCSNVESNNGYPVSIKQIADKFKVSKI